MKVKIKNKIYDSNIESLMLIFDTKKERITVGEHLFNLPEKTNKNVEASTKYCMYSDNTDEEVIKEFMKNE